MNAEVGVLVIVEAGAPQIPVSQPETQRTNEVQVRADIGAQADHVACVGRYFGLIEHNVEHRWVEHKYL